MGGSDGGEGADLGGRIELLALGDKEPWRRALRASLGGGQALGGREARAVHARCRRELRALAARGTATDREVRLLVAAGLLGPYADLATDEEALRAAWAARELDEGDEGRAGRAATALPPADRPGLAPMWAALLQEEYDPEEEPRWIREAWERLCGCAAARSPNPGGPDPVLVALADGDARGCRPGPGLRRSIRAIRPPGRMVLLERRADRWPGLARALAASLPPRAVRHTALSLAARDTCSPPWERMPTVWVAIRRASPASRLRCARLLAARGAWAAALELADTPGRGTGRERAAVLRGLLGCADPRGAYAAAWALTRRGHRGDARAILGTLARTQDTAAWGQTLAEAAYLLRRAPRCPVALAIGVWAAGRATRDGGTRRTEARDWPGRHQTLRMLEKTGISPGALARLAASMLEEDERDGRAGARWLVANAPYLAHADALLRAGLLPPARRGQTGRLPAATYLEDAWAAILG